LQFAFVFQSFLIY